MATKTFGRRGAAPRIASPSFQPARVTVVAAAPAVEPPAEPSAFHAAIRDNKLIADIPFLTFGVIAFLVLVFMLEKRFAFDVGSGNQMSHLSLIAFGASSRDLVVGAGEWWRIALAPILHATTSHIVGNSIALAFVGWRLEPIIGRGWFLLIFVVSGIGGEVGSLYGNDPGISSVGASGAITGLIGALFVMSFNPYADIDQQTRMRRTALRFGVPALLPLAWGASDGTDYFGHAGGALAGGAVGTVICMVWSHDSLRPNFARVAGMIALAGFAGSLLASGFAATHYRAYAAEAQNYIRLAELPTDMRAGKERSAQLLARYPKDPLAHVIRAVYFVEEQRLAEAEGELRNAIKVAPADGAGRVIRARARALLAAVLMEQGRRAEAKDLAVETCRARDSDPLKKMMLKAKLCD
jgi:membrane associated rhomboid family serine protease